jgi:hypothetical protein
MIINNRKRTENVKRHYLAAVWKYRQQKCIKETSEEEDEKTKWG